MSPFLFLRQFTAPSDKHQRELEQMVKTERFLRVELEKALSRGATVPADDLESKVTQALINFGGPPELAPQLVAIAFERGLAICGTNASPEALVMSWIRFHVSDEWSARQFHDWLLKLIEAVTEFAVRENVDSIIKEIRGEK